MSVRVAVAASVSVGPGKSAQVAALCPEDFVGVTFVE